MNKTIALALLLVLVGCGTQKEDDVVIPWVSPGGGEGGAPNQPGGDDDDPTPVLPPYKVDCKKTVSTASWTSYEARTVYCIEGFSPKADPEVDQYGGWKGTNVGNADGFFRTRKIGNRWWLVDPLGNLFLSKAVAVFSPGSSSRQQQNIKNKFGSNSAWAQAEMGFLRDLSFNSLGAWSQVDIVKNCPEPMPYTVILSPMGTYNGALKAQGAESEGYKAAGWEGYPYDFAMVFNPEFDNYVESTISKASSYKNDKYLIGYFIDNEIPWKDYALERCLTKWPSTHINHQKAQEWLDQRKGKTGASFSEATIADKKAFIAYCYDVYLEKVTTALKKYDPNHLFLGDRFNQWSYELVNDQMFITAGKYVDVVSINHYQRWQPDAEQMAKWGNWAEKPFLVTEFYTKGLDSGMGNTSGAGWVVKTQADRGLFYENFVNELIKSGNCVGWQWFTYMDNDPTNTGSDDSNVDSNKGIVTWDCQRYEDLISRMREINECTYNLTRFYDK